MKTPHAGLNDTAVLYVKIKITKIPFERSSILRYRKRPCPPQERFLTLTFLRKNLSVDTLSKVQNQTITDFLFDPLSPKSDQREISPYNINALENRVVMRIEYMIREDESNWYFNKFSPLLLLKKYNDSKLESQFWYQCLKGLKSTIDNIGLSVQALSKSFIFCG